MMLERRVGTGRGRGFDDDGVRIMVLNGHGSALSKTSKYGTKCKSHPRGRSNKTHRPFHSLVPLSPHHATTLYVILINHRMQTWLVAPRLANPVHLGGQSVARRKAGDVPSLVRQSQPGQVRLHSHSGRIVMCSCSATGRSHRSSGAHAGELGQRGSAGPVAKSSEPIESSTVRWEYRYDGRSTLHASFKLSTLDGTTACVSMRGGIRLSGSASCVCNNRRKSAVLI